MKYAVEVQNLNKSFGDIRAVDHLSFRVAKGDVYGFLGQNGAGKSTTIRMLLTLVRPGSGSIQMLGKSLYQHRAAILRRTGAVIEGPDLYKYLTAFENLKMLAALSGVHLSSSRIMHQLEKVGLKSRAHSKVKTFSQGMKQRLGIASALVHDPDLVILDEPTNGLDPQGIADIRNLILHLSKNENKTVIVSSHLLSEMELVADAMLIIDKGKKIAEGKMKDLLDPSDTIIDLQTTDNENAFQQILSTRWAATATIRDSRSIQLKMHRNEIPQFIRVLVERGIAILSLHSRYSLEAYFLSLTTPSAYVDVIED